MQTTRYRKHMNEREARNIRFLVLLGLSHGEIAGRLGRNRKTVDRTIREKDLGGPEAPLELAWLTLRRSLEAMADAQADGGEVDVGKLAKLNTEMRLTEAAMRAAAREAPKAEMGDAGEPDDDGVWERLEAVEQQRRLDAAGPPSEGAGHEGGAEQSATGDEGVPETKSIHPVRPRYAGAAAGRLADMAVHGRTWRGQDAGGGGMGADGGAPGMPPCGAGGAGAFGCARGDDRGAERAAPA
ncbi:MAG: hypothetical protein V7675_06805 [Hyphomonas sp.]